MISSFCEGHILQKGCLLVLGMLFENAIVESSEEGGGKKRKTRKKKATNTSFMPFLPFSDCFLFSSQMKLERSSPRSKRNSVSLESVCLSEMVVAQQRRFEMEKKVNRNILCCKTGRLVLVVLLEGCLC